MKRSKSNHIGDTVRIRRPPPKVFTDALGKNIWMSGVAPCEPELELDPGSNTNPYDSNPVCAPIT